MPNLAPGQLLTLAGRTLGWLAEHPGSSSADVARALGVTERGAYKALANLVKIKAARVAASNPIRYELNPYWHPAAAGARLVAAMDPALTGAEPEPAPIARVSVASPHVP